MRNFAAVFAAVVMFAFPGVALGQGSGSDAYEENIPGGGGNTPSNNDGGTEGGNPLPEATQGALEEQGADGEAAANLAQETGPGGNGNDARADNSTGSGSGNGSDSGSAVNLTPADGEAGSGGSGIDEVVGELAGGSDDGMGILLPIILGSVLVAGVAFVIIRRSSGGPAGSA